MALYRLRIRQVAKLMGERLEERVVERERIARELHDTLLQGFQGLMLRFQAVANRMPPQEPIRQMMESALERADQVLIDGRNRVRDLRSVDGTAGDLLEALKETGRELAEEAPGVELRIVVQGTAQTAPDRSRRGVLDWPRGDLERLSPRSGKERRSGSSL